MAWWYRDMTSRDIQFNRRDDRRSADACAFLSLAFDTLHDEYMHTVIEWRMFPPDVSTY